ncbi:MAG: hypothetical protein V5783_04880 [Pontiella sp.]
MKCVFLSLIAFSSVLVTAQQEVVQAGTPALLEAANGRKIKVMLQSIEDDKLTFQPFKSTKDMTVPASKIKNLQFFPKYDQDAVDAAFISGDFRAVLDIMEPVMADYIEYMAIDNNMRKSFVQVYNCYRFNRDYDNMAAYAERLVACGDDDLVLKGKAGLALVALSKEDLVLAEKLSAEVAEISVVAGLYLKAEIERAQGNSKEAIQTVTIMIEEYANDVEWLPASELLIAYCYLDMTGTNSVITTNSALNTARQVKNMYAGSAVAADAEKLWASLGGAELEAEIEAEKAVLAAEAEERREKRRVDEKARKEKKAAEKAAQKAAEV